MSGFYTVKEFAKAAFYRYLGHGGTLARGRIAGKSPGELTQSDGSGRINCTAGKGPILEGASHTGRGRCAASGGRVRREAGAYNGRLGLPAQRFQ